VLRLLESAALFSAAVFVVALIGLMMVYSSQPPYQPQQQQSAEEGHPHEDRGDSRESFWKRTASDPIALYTLGLLIFSMVLAGAAVAQLKSLIMANEVATRSAEAARKSADAARDAVTLADKTAERQLRAYVLIYDSQICLKENMLVVAGVGYKNSGQTPARDVVVWTKIEGRPYPLIGTLGSIKAENASRAPIGAGGVANMEIPAGGSLTSEQLDGIQKGTKAIYVWGEITYRDIFDAEHRTKFARFYHGPLSSAPVQMFVSPEGNEDD
jgi:hypothetical protein